MELDTDTDVTTTADETLAPTPAPRAEPKLVNFAPKKKGGPEGGWTRETLEKRLLRKIAKASEDFGLIEPNDHIMVCVSGGKDSYSMLHLLRELRRHTPFPFTMVAVNLDQKQPNFPADVIPRYMTENGYDYLVVERDTYSVVTEKVPEGKTYCSLCSRLRRGILYDTAQKLGATKIALGHHRDDVIETLMLNLLYSGQMKAMPPKLRSDDGRNIVIRPLIYCHEEEIALLAKLVGFPIIPCDLCGSQEGLKRNRVKQLISELHADNPAVRGNMFAALGNVRPTHLMDRKLHAAIGLDLMVGRDEGVDAIEGGGGGCS
ncbi:MAG: tRNA 2-thiocytidine(32) synthetase TtcA [Deltaproteobacteria bacterium]|jgi:tRNA 2-thiocytidine biosynthesis protein TtcA|nr:tRNA 2-thiocytidine(32) synthetase TtcA [Deltaproteobacteria bacterium]